MKTKLSLAMAIWLCVSLACCSGGSSDGGSPNDGSTDSGGNLDVSYTLMTDDMPAAGNPDGYYPVPDEAMEEDTSSPDHTIGDGTPESCTSEAVVAAVAQGGIISFDCGPDPVTIVMEETAKIVIDGSGLVTLSGQLERRILYMNTCDQAQVWTTSHCQDQDHPRLTVQNLIFIHGNAGSSRELDGGGGAIWVRGGRFKEINCRCNQHGPTIFFVSNNHDGILEIG